MASTSLASAQSAPPQFAPELRLVIDAQPGFNLSQIQVGLAFEDGADGATKPVNRDRSLIALSDSAGLVDWTVPSLRALFRGNQVPPSLIKYPPDYIAYFAAIERHVFTFAGAFGEPSDQDLREIYNTLRRLPDGRSTGPLHDYLWQVMALMLGTWPLSQAQYEAIINQLERSCKTFSMGASSHNYLAYLKGMFGGAQRSL
jgi:hypothetical protein